MIDGLTGRDVWVYPLIVDGDPPHPGCSGTVLVISGSILFVKVGDVINAVDPAKMVVRLSPSPEAST